MYSKIPGKDSNARCDKHGYGEVEAANEGVVPGRCIWEDVFDWVMREIDAVCLDKSSCKTTDCESRFRGRNTCRIQPEDIEEDAFQDCRLTETVPHVKQLIVKQAPTHTQPYPPSGGTSSLRPSSSLISLNSFVVAHGG